MFKPALSVLAVVAAVVAVSAALITRKEQPPSSMPQNAVTELPANAFDSSATIPDTKVSFAYPSMGFYGLGADVLRNNAERSVVVQTAVPYVAEKGSEYVTLTASADKRAASQQTLDAVVSAIDPNSIVGQYVKLNGEHRTLNGRQFFLTKVTENVTMWHAWTLEGNDVVSFTLAYKATEGAESQAAYSNNDKLFVEILEHVSAK